MRSAALLISVLLLWSCNARAKITKPGEGDFRSEDGFLLDGTLYGKGSKAVVLAHAYPEDQSSWKRFAQDLADAGYLVLTFDFRGYGLSQGDKKAAMTDRDLRGAVRYLRTVKKARSVVLVGASMGGTAALIAAADSEVDGVAALSAPSKFRGLDAQAMVFKVDAPKIFIASVGDTSGSDSAKAMFAKAVDPSSDLELVPGDARGTDMLEGDQGEEVRDVLEDFIAEVTS